jgi:hypothetical protein
MEEQWILSGGKAASIQRAMNFAKFLEYNKTN